LIAQIFERIIKEDETNLVEHVSMCENNF